MRSCSQDLSWILDCISFPVPVSIPPAKAKGQAAKLNINAALVEDIINLGEVKSDMGAVVSTLKDDFTRSLSIRTSLGNPSFSKLFFRKTALTLLTGAILGFTCCTCTLLLPQLLLFPFLLLPQIQSDRLQ